MKMRTKLKDRILPTYTKGEEIFNMVSHIVGRWICVNSFSFMYYFFCYTWKTICGNKLYNIRNDDDKLLYDV